MGKKIEKGKKGEAVQYYSRKQALRHLQIGLPNFTRLCLWKGIYPTEPNNKKAVTKGDSKPKIYFKRKDINILLHDPIINKLREIRTYNLKLKKAKEKNDKDKIYRLQKAKPRYDLFCHVKELYPTTDDALNNLNDCMNHVFVFATLPKMTQFNSAWITLCKQLKLQFMNYCINKQALRKCYISIKGIYMQAEIRGIPITWIVPHQNTSTNLPTSGDFRFMANQLEFYCAMLSAVLKELYVDDGLVYPPKFRMDDREDGVEWTENDILCSMSFPLMSNERPADEHVENMSQFMAMDEDTAAVAEKDARIASIQTLFKDKKVFLNREVPREIYCFLLRSCGANVSWERSVADGATFDETDDDIHYHIIDRPLVNPRVTRFYVQPQYVVDSINAARLLPVKDYMPGMELIPHVSPFVDYTKGYVPPEYLYLKGEIDADALYVPDEDELGEEGDLFDEMEEEFDENDLMGDESEDENKVVAPAAKKKSAVAAAPKRKSKEELQKEIDANKEIKLRELSLPRKRLNLYKKMKHAEKKEKSTVDNLKRKRQEINKNRSMSKK